ncbi:MAG: SMP-30/gluconolactonase/LRE family protein [candidate division WOR-3 bacterium]|nr:MAG: SMP-30/gluconolactonase/LRE family protein [candidate division WOR-3 bacterium]
MASTIRSLFLLSFTVLSIKVFAQTDGIDFESGRWVLDNAQIVEHLDRKSLIGYAFLRDADFENGIIEADIAVTGHKVRSYPGIIFRMQSEENYENFYIRPHRASLYPDALQYTPVTNGISSWQLYNGEGFTASADIPPNQWIHLKMEISGKQARVYIDNAQQPALIINDLKHGVSKGTIGLLGPVDGTAYFSNFTYRIDNNLQFDPPPPVDIPPGLITDWHLSQAFKFSQIDIEKYPDEKFLAGIDWQEAKSEASGLIDIARYVKRVGTEPDVVLAKTFIDSEKNKVIELRFGYSDLVSIFLNGELYFVGSSVYQSRDPSFLGIIGFFDSVYLPFKKGKNELLLIIAEAFGGWGFMCQDGDAIFEQKGLVRMWQTPNDFKIPESVVYDRKSNVFYVSNYDGYNPSINEGKQSISKISFDGSIEDLDWITGVKNPAGLTIFQDKLFVAERRSVLVIDIASQEIQIRYEIPQSSFLNDIAIDYAGNIYVSDSRKSIIFKLVDGEFQEWLKGEEINDPNGLIIDGDKLIFGNNGDNFLKSVDLDTRAITTIVNLGSGIIDGIKVDNNGDYFVSHWEGRIFRITPSGDVTKILDISVPNIYCADFEYVQEHNLLVIPTFLDHRVIAYQIGG